MSVCICNAKSIGSQSGTIRIISSKYPSQFIHAFEFDPVPNVSCFIDELVRSMHMTHILVI